jgi:alpha-amylase
MNDDGKARALRAALVAGMLGLLAACAPVPPAGPASPAGAGAPGGAGAALRVSPDRRWDDEILYFVLVDRFADGDPGNNQGVDRRNPGGWHGGDLKGLREQLGELQDLGVTAIWINPVQLQQARGMSASAPGASHFVHEGFHGYWIQDFSRMEPRFGTEAELKALVDAAHARGIRVLLDVVVNHAGYSSVYQGRRTAGGEPWLRRGEGNCEVDPLTCAVGGLPDFRTEIPEVRDHVIDANIALARRVGVDGFRIDTYKHVASEVWIEHRRRTRAALGAGFFLLAEYWGGTAESLDGFFARDEVDAGFDFSFKGSCEGWVTGRGRSVAYAAYLRNRHKLREGYLLSHYLSSHDEPMMLGKLGGDRDRFRVCAALQMSSLGMPMIYYGEEVGRGGHEWPFNRNDMPWSDRAVMPGQGVARDEALRADYKRLIEIRKSHPALRRGGFTMLAGRDDRHLAFAREHAASGDRVLVLANREAAPLTAELTLPAGWPAGAQRDLLTGEVFAATEGRLRAELAPTSVRIVVPVTP